MIRRPNKNDTEDDLLRESQNWNAKESSIPSARIFKPEKAENSQKTVDDFSLHFDGEGANVKPVREDPTSHVFHSKFIVSGVKEKNVNQIPISKPIFTPSAQSQSMYGSLRKRFWYV